MAQSGPANPNVVIGTREFNCKGCGKPVFISYEAGRGPGMGITSETIRCPWDCGHESQQDLPGKLLRVEKTP